MGFPVTAFRSWSIHFEKYSIGRYILHNRKRVLGWLEKCGDWQVQAKEAAKDNDR